MAGEPKQVSVTMKALSIVRPSGGRIAAGEKTLEVRRWMPPLNPWEDLLIVENDRFLHQEGDEDADGRPVAVVKVVRARPFVPSDMKAACASSFEEGWLAWELADIRPIRMDIRVRAARRIYEVELPYWPLTAVGR